MIILATDLDRTLIPNGDASSDNTLPLFKRLVQQHNICLVYVTGRNLEQITDAIQKYHLPYPNYVIAHVGSTVCSYDRAARTFSCDHAWVRTMREQNPTYRIPILKRLLTPIPGLTLQGKDSQDPLKLSYYVDLLHETMTLHLVKQQIRTIPDAAITYSHDYPEQRGLLDIMPKTVSKRRALDHLVRKLGVRTTEVFVAGDSGNDLSLLLSRYNAIVVRNAAPDVKRAAHNAKKANIFVARKRNDLNGNYVSGIIQGLMHFGVVSRNDISHQPIS